MKTSIHLLFVSVLSVCSAVAQVRTPTVTVPAIKGVTDSFPFANNRPICVVLIHGITGFPDSATTTPRPGTLRHARYYWQPEFVRGLMGVTEDDPVTFTNSTLMRPSNWETANCSNARISDHLMSATGKPDPARGFYPFLSVMFTYRDGSRPLANQTADVAAQIRQIYRSSFESWPAEKQPQLILLCHSGGGLVARTICSMPTSLGGGRSGSFPLDKPIIARSFNITEREDMNYVRRRTMYVTTLSTPHEGAQVAQVANQLGQYIQFVPGIGETDPDAPILAELTPLNMLAYNRNQLHPSNCKRPDGSLIPVYCIGGRAPGGPEYYADPNQHDLDLGTPDGGIRFSKDQLNEVRTDRSNRREFEAYGLMKADYATQTIWKMFFSNPLNPASSVAYGLTPRDNPQLDIVRTMDVHYGPLNPGSLGAPDFNPVNIGIGPRLFYLRNNWSPVMTSTLGVRHPSGRFTDLGRTTLGDGIIDCDGFVPINSALGAKLGTNLTNAFSNTRGGSWYRFYRSAADYHNHGSVTRSKEVGDWLRQNITGCHAANQLLGFVRTNIAAGPRVGTGPKSTW
jgi:hypothetical protein